MFRPTGIYRIGLITFIWTAALSLIAGEFWVNLGGGRLAAAFLNMGYTWLGLLFYFFWLGILTGLLYWILRAVVRLNWISLPLPIWQNGFPTTATVIISILFAWAVVGMFAVQKPVIKALYISLSGKTRIENPITVVQLSDLHLDEMKSVTWWEDIVQRTNQLHPDLILLTGDNIDEKPIRLHRFKPGLKKLSAGYGVFAVTGNHEFYIGPDQAMALLTECGVQVLRNDIHIIPGILTILGIDDITGIRTANLSPPDFQQLKTRIPPDLPLIVMNHQPVYIPEVQTLNADLQLSGHTHNGQIWPFKIFTSLIFKYQNGLHHVQDLHQYTSAGTGTWGPPFRIGTQSEITVIRLYPTQAS